MASDRRQSRWIEIATGLAIVPIVIAVALFYPPAREAIADARRSAATLLGAAEWTGYYLELDPTARPGEESSPQLLFAEGSVPGRGVRLVDPPVFAGRWSPSGERFAFTSGRRLLLADKRGEVRSLGELLDLTPAGPPVWVNEHEILMTMARERPLGRWYVRIDANGALLDQRSLAFGLTIDSASADGRYALARSSIGLDLIDIAAGTTKPAPDGFAYVGWLNDGRVLLRGTRAGLYQLEARLIDAGLGERLAEMDARFDVRVRGPWIAVLEHGRTRGEIASVWLLRRGAAARRVLTDLADLSDAQPSADGRFITFTTGFANEPTARTGVLDVASGAVTYACAAGCADLRLR